MSKLDRYLQLPLTDLPGSGYEDLAFVALSASDIQRKSKIEFSRSYDDLDYYDGAVIRFGLGGFVFLKQYLRSPVAGTVIVCRPDDRSSLSAAVRILDLKRRDIIWVRDDMRTIVASALRKRFVALAQKSRNETSVPVVRARQFIELRAA